VSVTIKDVEHVASLAQLSFSEEEKQKLTHELNEILAYMEQLNSLDTTNVEPMAQVTYPAAENPALRLDAPYPAFSQKEALANAPEPAAEYFKVPLVIEKE